MLRAEPAIERTAVARLRLKLERQLARLVEAELRQVELGVRVDERLERPVLGAALAQHDFVVADIDLGVDDPLAHGADRSRELEEDLVALHPHGFLDAARTAIDTALYRRVNRLRRSRGLTRDAPGSGYRHFRPSQDASRSVVRLAADGRATLVPTGPAAPAAVPATTSNEPTRAMSASLLRFPCRLLGRTALPAETDAHAPGKTSVGAAAPVARRTLGFSEGEHRGSTQPHPLAILTSGDRPNGGLYDCPSRL